MKSPALFQLQGEIITKKQKYIDEIKKNLLLQNHWTNFNKAKHPWVKGIQVCSNEGHARFQGEIIAKT